MDNRRERLIAHAEACREAVREGYAPPELPMDLLDLVRADLTGADLTGANLADADLMGADLTGANLADANLSGADLTGARGLPDIDRADLRRRVADQIEQHPETHDQTTWHNACGTAHCVAGWTAILAGDLGRYMEQQLGTPTAAHLLLGGRVRPSFAAHAERSHILQDLRAEGGA